MLNSHQRDQWARSGYLQIADFFEETDKLVEYCNDLQVLEEVPGKWMKYFEYPKPDQRQLCRIEKFIEFHRGWHDILMGPRMAAVLADLFGEAAVLYKEKINFKLPGGGGFKAHQDAPAYDEFGHSMHITAMIAIDPANTENGCFQIVDGPRVLKKLSTNSDLTIKSDWEKNFIWQPLVSARGDLLLFDSYLPHRSGPNNSANSRRLLFATYNRESEGDRRADYFSNKRRTFPPECELDPAKSYEKHNRYNVGNPITAN